MLFEYKTSNGQSIKDICLNIYGNIDLIYKLIRDSGTNGINYIPKTGDVFLYDPTLIIGNSSSRTKIISDTRYATLANIDLSDLDPAFRNNYNS